MTNYSEQFYMKKVRVILRVLFIIFTFCYLYFLQGDLLSLTQKQLSQGQTTYNPLAGAIVLTSLLTLLQYFIEQHITVINRLHAYTRTHNLSVNLHTDNLDNLQHNNANTMYRYCMDVQTNRI